MKLTGAKARGFLAKPDERFGCVLLHGANSIRVADQRSDLSMRLVGPDAAKDLRLTVLQAAQLTRKIGAIADALKAVGFFPGPRLVIVEGANDALHAQLAKAIDDRAAGDAYLVATAGALTTRSRVRKLFESADTAVAIGVYDEPLARETVETMESAAGLTVLTDEGRDLLIQMSATRTASEIRATIEKLALYSMNSSAPLGPSEIEMLAPDSRVAGMDDVVFAVAEGRPSDVTVPLHRLYAQGVSADQVCQSAYSHFRSLHKLALHDGRLDAAFMKLRPPVFGPARERMTQQVRRWSLGLLEVSLRELFDMSLELRSSTPGPTAAIVERTLLRIAWRAPKSRSAFAR